MSLQCLECSYPLQALAVVACCTCGRLFHDVCWLESGWCGATSCNGPIHLLGRDEAVRFLDDLGGLRDRARLATAVAIVAVIWMVVAGSPWGAPVFLIGLGSGLIAVRFWLQLGALVRDPRRRIRRSEST